MNKISGGCLCGTVRYEIEADPIVALRCHCRDCQYVAGGEPTVVLLVPSSGLRCIHGKPREYRTKADSGTGVFRSFCENCGTPLFAGNEAAPQMIAIKLGSLDDPSRHAPNIHIWTSSAQPWHHIDAAIPSFPKNFNS